MYGLYINDKLSNMSEDLELIKNLGFILALRGHKVSYRLLEGF